MTRPHDPEQATRWHVVTGGPSSGKTTTVNLLRARGLATTIEHARQYIDLQRLYGRDTAEVRVRQREFQSGVVAMQIAQERALDPEQTIFLDRAIPDSLAYYRFLDLEPEPALTLTDTGDLSGPLGGADFDAMGLTADGDVLYASGHPGPNTPAELGEHNLGLIRSTDAGTTWEPVAFTGQEDFHVLTAGDGAIHGIGSSSITIRTSTDGGTTWIDGAELPAADLTVTTDGTLYAATRQGLQESRDAGATFDLVADAPPLYLVEADSTGGLVGVDTDGTLWRLTGTGSWDSVGAATGTVQALGNADGAVVLVDDRGIVWIHGTETTVVLPAGTAQ